MTERQPGPGQPVWEGLFELAPTGEAFLRGYRCGRCGHTGLLSARICPACLAEAATEPIRLSRSGALYSYTVIHQGPKGFEPPYAVGYVDLPEGVRVFAHLGGDPDQCRAGMPVRLTVGTIGRNDDGMALLGPRFVPMTEGGGAPDG